TTPVPTLIVCGSHDSLTPVRRHEFIAGLIPNATLRVIEDAGHLPTLETPDELLALLREWLGELLVLR
ncbi:MAG: alpha/beta fold hydrolase, partial [Halocynthiibacter sp.]